MMPPIGANVMVVYRPTAAPPEIHFGRVTHHHPRFFIAEWLVGQIHQIMTTRCDPAEEGVEWCRDWSGAKVKALKVLVALG